MRALLLLSLAGCVEMGASAPPCAHVTVGAEPLTWVGEGPFAGLALSFPAGAWATPTVVTIQRTWGPALPDGGEAVGPQFHLAAPDWAGEVEVRLPYHPGWLRARGEEAGSVKIWRAVDGTPWTLAEPEAVGAGRATLRLGAPGWIGAGLPGPES